MRCVVWKTSRKLIGSIFPTIIISIYARPFSNSIRAVWIINDSWFTATETTRTATFCTNSITRRDFRCLHAQRQTWRGLHAGRIRWRAVTPQNHPDAGFEPVTAHPGSPKLADDKKPLAVRWRSQQTARGQQAQRVRLRGSKGFPLWYGRLFTNGAAHLYTVGNVPVLEIRHLSTTKSRTLTGHEQDTSRTLPGP